MSFLLAPAPFDFSAIFSNIGEDWYYYLGLLIAFGLLLVYFLLNKKDNRANLNSTQKITYYAIFTALCIAVNALSITITNILSISFVATFCFITGYLFGAKGGFIIGFLGDLIGGIIFPKGIYMPMLALASGMFGFIPGMIFDKFKLNNNVAAVISFALTLICCTVFLNTLGLYLAYGINKSTFWIYLWARLPFQTLVAIGNCVLSCCLINLLNRILPKDKFPFVLGKNKQTD